MGKESVPFPLETMSGATEVALETSKGPSLLELEVFQNDDHPGGQEYFFIDGTIWMCLKKSHRFAILKMC